MWKNYIDIIQERDINYTHQEYCLWFAGYFSYQIYTLESFKTLLEKNNGDLLPISQNIVDYFQSSNIEAIINFIYHINDLDNLDFLIMKTNHETNIDYLFNFIDYKTYFCNVFSYDPELLLQQNNQNATLLFLFLFFLPQHKYQDSLKHPRKKIPLISCNKISFSHFEMLLYLMKTYTQEEFNLLCYHYNLNMFLLEDFCHNSSTLYFTLDNDQWYEILPIDKIKTLFNENCMLSNFLDFKDKNVYYSVPTLAEFIQYFQKELEFLKLKEKLTSKKGQSIQKEKVVKI